MEEQRNLLPRQNYDNLDDCDEWSDGSSYSSYYSDSDSSVPEWETSVNESTGQVLYIDCHPFVVQNNIESNEEKNKEPFTKSQVRQSTRGKFLRLIRRRESKRRSKRFQRSFDTGEINTSKVKFQDFQEGEEREVLLKIEPNQFSKLGRKTATIEYLLGISVSTLSDGNRLMVAGFSQDGKAKNEKSIKIGDWLKSINNKNVTKSNLNIVLEQICDNNEVLLKLQRVAGIEVTKDPPVHELNNQSNFVRQLIEANDEELESSEVLHQYPVGILYLNTDKLSESGPEYEDIIYCYPQPMQKNMLCNARGMFITLNHLLNEVTKSKPLISSVLYKDKLAYIVYTSFESQLLLHMLPADCVSVQEMLFINKEVIRMFQFMYRSIDNSFENGKNVCEVNNFFSRYFIRILNGFKWITSPQFIEVHNNPTKSLKSRCPLFEDILPAVPILTLPDEAQMQIDDALTELEASDYREWNEEPLDCQRLFTILGTALYHAGYLLAFHLMYDDLIDIHSYCRQQGLYHLSKTEPLKSLVLWREVYPTSCYKNTEVAILDGRRYLLIVGVGKNLLAVIMEAGGCTEPPEENMGPDAFYVEEAQATLAHIQEVGIPELAERYISLYLGNQTILPTIPNNKRKSDFIGNINFLKPNPSSPSNVQKKPEVTSILKRRSSDQGIATHSSSVYSLPEENYSEDSGSQGGYSEKSEINDEPVLGRRISRERKSRYDSDEDSDADDYEDTSQISNSSFDISELRQTLLSEIEESHPVQLTAGEENVLFHYVRLDTTEGILIQPPTSSFDSKTLELILDTFRMSCQKIHALFDNTIRFRNMSAQDMAKSMINKSLIAVKEHGILFECPFLDDRDTKKHKITFWVIGRLFHMPHAREVYVCYQDIIPQNLVELAFKINLNMTL